MSRVARPSAPTTFALLATMTVGGFGLNTSAFAQDDVPTEAEIQAAETKAAEAEAQAQDAQTQAEAARAEVEAMKAKANPAQTAPEGQAPSGVDLFSGWKNHFEAGINGSEGNTEKTSIYLSLVSNRETTASRQQFDASYLMGSSDGNQDVGKASAGLRNDWILDESPYFLWAQGRYDWDKFQTWEHRVQAFAGGGKDLIKESDRSWRVLLGAGATREFNSPNDDYRPEGLVGTDVFWAFTPNQRLTYEFRYYPDFNDAGEFRLTNNAKWEIDLPDWDNSNLSFGIKHEYDSHAEGDVKENDLFYYVAIGFDF